MAWLYRQRASMNTGLEWNHRSCHGSSPLRSASGVGSRVLLPRARTKPPLAGTDSAQVALEKALDSDAPAEHHQLTN